jgi:hypothetical protein
MRDTFSLIQVIQIHHGISFQYILLKSERDWRDQDTGDVNLKFLRLAMSPATPGHCPAVFEMQHGRILAADLGKGYIAHTAPDCHSLYS